MSILRGIVRDAVARTEGNFDETIPLVFDWLRTAITTQEAFEGLVAELRRESGIKGRPTWPRELRIAVNQVYEQAQGNDATVTRMLMERLDRRENPTFHHMAHTQLRRSVMRPLKQMILKEIRRFKRKGRRG